VIDEAKDRNFDRWPILGEYVWPNQFVGNTHQEEIAWLKNWIAERLIWMDVRMSGNCSSWVNDLEDPAEETGLEVFPNPFTQTVSIRLTVDREAKVFVEIVDLSGHSIRVLKEKSAFTWEHGLEFIWEGRDDHKRSVQSGLYLANISINGSWVGTVKVVKF
jgi:flagellar hook assembly protein FlgD